MNIKAPTRPWQGASEAVKRLATAVRRGDPQPNQARRDGTGVQSAPLERYVSGVSQSLAVFRFVSFAMGAGLVFALNPSDQTPVDPLRLGPVVLLVGTFNVYRILWRFDPARPRNLAQWTSLGVDMLLSISLTVMSGGLNSPFLIYSLSPILTASLLLNLESAMVAASVSAVSMLGIHLLAGLGITSLPGFLERNYLLLLALLYSAVCSLVVSLPFLANLN